MDARFQATVGAAPARVAPVLADLATYPRWLSIVHRVEAVAAVAQDPGPTWSVDLGAKLGPLTRSKRVRMVRVQADDREVRFERREVDGRSHSDWVLTAMLDAENDREVGVTRTELAVHLHYSGAPSLPFLDRILGQEARRAAGRLETLVTTRAD